MTIVLHPGNAISGRVFWAQSQRPAIGFTIYAFQDGQYPSRDALRVAREKAQSAELVYADAGSNGEFTLAGLAPGSHYSLVAAGDGGCARPSLVGVVPGARPVQLPCVPMYAITIHLMDDTGNPMMVSDGVYGDGPSLDCKDTHVLSLTRTPVELLLIGGDHEVVSRNFSASIQRFEFLGDDETHESIPVEYSVRPAGYEQTTASLRAQRVRGPVPDENVKVHRRAKGWGTIVINNRSYCAGLSVADGNSTRYATVRMVSESGENVYLALDKPCAPEVVVNGVPFGTYQARVTFDDWQHSFPAAGAFEVIVGGGRTAFDIDAQEIGSVLVRVFEEDGTEYEGAIGIDVASKKSTRTRMFEHAPYVIEGMPGDQYDFGVAKSAFCDFLQSAPVAVQVVPGALVECVLRTRRL